MLQRKAVPVGFMTYQPVRDRIVVMDGSEKRGLCSLLITTVVRNMTRGHCELVSFFFGIPAIIPLCRVHVQTNYRELHGTHTQSSGEEQLSAG